MTSSSSSGVASAERALKACLGPPKIIISGAPASGKTVQCELISAAYGCVHLSTGDMLREAAAAGTPTGLIAQEFMNAGKLVTDEIIIGIIKDRLAMQDCQTKGWLLDGFPRTRVQAAALSAAGITADAFLFLDVPDEVLLVERVSGRQTDPVTGTIYHVKFNPPSTAEVAARVTQSGYDTEENVKVRLEEFYENIEAVINCYENNNIVVKVNGIGDKHSIYALLQQFIDGHYVTRPLHSRSPSMDSFPPSSPPDFLPTAAAALLQSMAANKGRRKPLDATSGPDFKSFVVSASSADRESPNAPLSKAISNSALAGRLKKTVTGLAPKIVPYLSRSSQQETAAQSQRSKRTGSVSQLHLVDGHACVYFHAASSELITDFVDVASPLFLLSFGGRTGARPTALKRSSENQRSVRVAPFRDVTKNDAPILLERRGGNDMFVLLYRNLRANIGVAEHLYRVTTVVEAGGAVCVYFETFGAAMLGDEAAKKLESARGQSGNKVKLTTAVESGCLILVSCTTNRLSRASTWTA